MGTKLLPYFAGSVIDTGMQHLDYFLLVSQHPRVRPITFGVRPEYGCGYRSRMIRHQDRGQLVPACTSSGWASLCGGSDPGPIPTPWQGTATRNDRKLEIPTGAAGCTPLSLDVPVSVITCSRRSRARSEVSAQSAYLSLPTIVRSTWRLRSNCSVMQVNLSIAPQRDRTSNRSTIGCGSRSNWAIVHRSYHSSPSTVRRASTYPQTRRWSGPPPGSLVSSSLNRPSVSAAASASPSSQAAPAEPVVNQDHCLASTPGAMTNSAASEAKSGSVSRSHWCGPTYCWTLPSRDGSSNRACKASRFFLCSGAMFSLSRRSTVAICLRSGSRRSV